MSLRVWLPLNGNVIQQGCSNVIATVNGATVNTAGKIGSCYSFDGSDDLISLSGTDLYSIITGGSQPMSFTFWIYHADATRAIIFGDYNLSGTIGFNIELTTAHCVRFYWNGSPNKNFNTESAVAASGWTHIAITYDGSVLRIYKDGVLSSDTNNGTLSTKTKTAGVYYLGRDSRTGETVLNGRLNDFRLYDHCLSAAEVREISQGLVLHYKLDNMSSTTVEDSSGYNHNGTRTGTISAYIDSPRYSQCMNLSETASRINCGRGGMVTDAITVNFWVNLPNVPSARSDTTGFVSCAETGGFRIQIGDNSHLRSIVYINSAYAVIEGETAIQPNTWYMITLVYDRLNGKLYEYLNGIKEAELDVGNPEVIEYNSNNVIWIGAEARSGTNYYSALAEKISDFRIYCTALSAEDIRQLYEVSAKIDNKQNLHSFELIEDQSKIEISKTGQTRGNELKEITATKFFKTDQIIETNNFIEI